MKYKSSSIINPRFIELDTSKLKLLFFALITGLLVGLGCAFFRISLSYIESIRKSLFENVNVFELLTWAKPLFFTIIAITISLFLVKKFAPEASGSGVHEIEGALDEIRPMRWKRVIPIKFIASLFSLGSGLLLGREGPTIQLGANIGKMLKDTFKLPDTNNNTLISTGAAAGLASAFNAPFAGIIFVIEEMQGHFKYNFYSLAAIMIGAGTADFIVRALIGSEPVIPMVIFSKIDVPQLWIFIILGLFFSVIGLIFNKLLIVFLNFFQLTFKAPLIVIGIIAGLTITIVGVFYPEMIGGGYTTIKDVIGNSFSLKFLLILFGVRLILSIFSYSIGTTGGFFTPMLTLGLILGLFFGLVLQNYFPDLIKHPGVFAVAGMAGIFASTVRSPLTGLTLAIEMTSNFELILPLIITTVTASVFTTILGNKPIYTTLLKRVLAQQNSKTVNV